MSYNSLLNIGRNSEVNVKSSKNVVIDYYIGDGKYDAYSPNSLTFDFIPDKIFILLNDIGQNLNKNSVPCVDMNEISTDWIKYNMLSYDGTGNTYICKSEDGKTVYWYTSRGADAQFNVSNTIYIYIAIGEK